MVPALKRLSLVAEAPGHGNCFCVGSVEVTADLPELVLLGRWSPGNCLELHNPWCLNMGSLWIRWGPPNRGNDCVEAGGAGGERIHLKQNRGDRSVLTAPQGSHGQDSRGEAVYHEAVGGDCF